MAKIITFANSKGGVAKTTTCLATGCCLAEMGYKVLLIDLDHQANLSDDLGRGDEDFTITDLFEDPKFDINKIIYPALDLEKEIPNLFVIPADITLAAEARSAERFRHRLTILSDAIKRIEMPFDFILIDARPAIDLSIENAFLVTDMTVIPVDQDKRATKGISDLFDVIKEVKRQDKFKYLVLKTKVDVRNKIMLESTEERLKKMKLHVANTQIGVSEDYKKATDIGRPITFFANGSKGHVEYMQFTNELLEYMNNGA